MKQKEFIEYLEKLDACKDAIDFVKEFPTAQKAWDACERGDWMLWLLSERARGKFGTTSHRKLIGTVVECAQLAKKFVSKKDKKIVNRCYDLCKRYAAGENILKREFRDVAAQAIYAANAAADAANYVAAQATYAANAADAADYATARAAYAAIYAASNATTYAVANAACAAANVAIYAANAAACAAAEKQILKKCANIVRKHYPKLRIRICKRKNENCRPS